MPSDERIRTGDPAGGWQRDRRLDFCRGLALVFIFIDHVPNNVLAGLTLQNFALADATEVFVVVAGIAAALGLGEVLGRDGTAALSKRVVKRALQLYAAHITLIVTCIGLLALAQLVSANPAAYFASPVFMTAPAATPDNIVGVLRLQIQPNHLNILPLYFVLVASLPVVLTLTRRSLSLALFISGGSWLLVQTMGWGYDATPGGWYFNPLAWQFLFVLGITVGFEMRAGRPLYRHRGLLLIAVAYSALALAAAAPWAQLPGLAGLRLVPEDWLGRDAKSNLSIFRISNVIALGYIFAYYVPASAAWLGGTPARQLCQIGRHGLTLFIAATLLDEAAMIIRIEGARGVLYQIGTNAAGLVILHAVAMRAEWWEQSGKTVGATKPRDAGRLRPPSRVSPALDREAIAG